MDQNDYYTFMNNDNYNDKILDLLFEDSIKNNKDSFDYLNFSNEYDKEMLKQDKKKLMTNHIMQLHNMIFKLIKNNTFNANNSKLLLELKNEINKYSLELAKLD